MLPAAILIEVMSLRTRQVGPMYASCLVWLFVLPEPTSYKEHTPYPGWMCSRSDGGSYGQGCSIRMWGADAGRSRGRSSAYSTPYQLGIYNIPYPSRDMPSVSSEVALAWKKPEGQQVLSSCHKLILRGQASHQLIPGFVTMFLSEWILERTRWYGRDS